ncbi:protein FAM133-like isoform X2 [Hibiscus syriacus]|uniref:protein FAM133-like isoform X2 n=1 Tax=Hibiscus syriacus TaxID=106335 RepID=UPI001922B3B1|nr:protein FAM133-like isoform X2 [Hibiscus syriacus]
MGKNQAHKAMQRAKLGSSSAGPEEIEDGMEDALRKGELEADTDRMMREYRAQLDAERASKLAHGRNHSSSKSSHKKDRKDKDAKKRSSKKRKRSRRRSSDSSSSSSSSESSSDDERESRRSKSKSRREKKKEHKSRNKKSTDNEEGEGPVPLSRFFGNVKS